MARQFDIREPSIEALRAAPIYFRWGGNKRRTLIDALTASAILAVYEAVNDDNKAKLSRMVTTPAGLSRVVSFAFQRVSITGGGARPRVA
jgi:hypothetical protein